MGLILNHSCRKFCINRLCCVIVVWGEEELLGQRVKGLSCPHRHCLRKAACQAERSTYCFLRAESSSVVIYSLCFQTTPRSVHYLWDS